MPRYTVTARSFINNALAHPGDIVDYDGLPGFNLEPADDEARAIVASMTAEQTRAAAMPDIEAFRIQQAYQAEAVPTVAAQWPRASE